MPELIRRNADQPLGDLNNNKYTYSNFIYPMDLGTPTAGKDHYMVFHINESIRTHFHTQTVNDQKPGETSTSNEHSNKPNPDGSPKKKADSNGNSKQGPNGNEADQEKFGNQTRPVQRV